MKHKMWVNSLMGAGFAFLLSVSAVENLITGCDLEVASMSDLLLWCAGCSLISALLFQFKHGEAVLLCVAVLVAPMIWKDGMLWDQLQSLCYTVSKSYHNAYGWPILGRPITDEVTRPLIMLSAWSAFSVSWSVCRRKPVLVAVPSVVLPLALCLIVTNTVPDEIYLYLLMLGIAMLLVTDWTRRKNPAQGVGLTLRLVVPMAAALALLFVMNPQEKYINHAGKYQKEVVSWFQKLRDTAQSVSSGVSFESAVSEKKNLRYVGPQGKLSYAVMRMNAPVNGVIYLRGRDYDIYSGTGWEASLNRSESFTSGGMSTGELTIVTHGVRDVLYVPYYATEELVLINGALDNDENLQSYSYGLSNIASGGLDMPDTGYTELPPDTLRWASALGVITDLDAASQSEKVRRIESYVQNAATYDLSTDRMRLDHSDFARWFLEESDTGYCVHFATAATVLLRAAGIPARYVEGYMVVCKAGEDVILTNQHAHAWAEYYDFGSGTWRILEATPDDWQVEEGTEATISTTTEATESNPAATLPSVNRETQPTVQGNLSGNAVGPVVDKKPFKLPNWIKTALWIVPAAAFVPFQSYLRIGWKRKQWDRGEPNEKLMTRWRQTKKMARIVRYPFPEELEFLAQKAKFSQHRMQMDELQLFEDYRNELLQTVRSKPWYQRILLRWILAVG